MNTSGQKSALALLRRPPPAAPEAFAEESRGSFIVSTLPPQDDALWCATLQHADFGTLHVEALASVPLAPQLAALDPFLSADYVLPAEASEIALAQGALRVSMTLTGSPFEERKRLLQATCIVAGPDTAGVLDESAQRMWGRAALEDELMHDGVLDIEALYSLHVVRDASGRVQALRSRGLAQLGARDFDVYRPHPSFGADGAIERAPRQNPMLSEQELTDIRLGRRDAEVRDLFRALAFRSFESSIDGAAWMDGGWLDADEVQQLTALDTPFVLSGKKRAQFVLLGKLRVEAPSDSWLPHEGDDTRVVVCEPAQAWYRTWVRPGAPRHEPLRLLQEPLQHAEVALGVLQRNVWYERAAASAPVFAELVSELLPQGHAAFAGLKVGEQPVRLCSIKGLVNGRLDAIDMEQPEGSPDARALYDLETVRFWSIPTLYGTIDVDHLSIARKLRQG